MHTVEQNENAGNITLVSLHRINSFVLQCVQADLGGWQISLTALSMDST